MPPTSSVHSVHFEDFDGTQFERLVFAYLLRTERWRTLEWYGQSGGDRGRDIWGVKDVDGYPDGFTVCVQCANRKRLTFEKVRSDLDRVSHGLQGLPAQVVVISGSSISAQLRDRIKRYAQTRHIWRCEAWSGAEFEERLRSNAESLLRRFTMGEAFPDEPEELRAFVVGTEPVDDHEILGLMAGLLDRPAF